MDNQSAQLTALAKQFAQKKLANAQSSLQTSPLMGAAKGYLDSYNADNKTPGFQMGQALQFSPIGIGSLGIKGALGALREAPVVGKALQESGIVAKTASKVLPKIPFEDIQRMENLIDNVRLKQPQDLQLELDARRIAENFGLNQPKRLGNLANVFDNFITKNYSKK